MILTLEDFRDKYYVVLEVKWYEGDESVGESDGFSWGVESVYICDDENFDYDLSRSDMERFKAYYDVELRDCILESI